MEVPTATWLPAATLEDPRDEGWVLSSALCEVDSQEEMAEIMLGAVQEAAELAHEGDLAQAVRVLRVTALGHYKFDWRLMEALESPQASGDDKAAYGRLRRAFEVVLQSFASDDQPLYLHYCAEARAWRFVRSFVDSVAPLAVSRAGDTWSPHVHRKWIDAASRRVHLAIAPVKDGSFHVVSSPPKPFDGVYQQDLSVDKNDSPRGRIVYRRTRALTSDEANSSAIKAMNPPRRPRRVGRARFLSPARVFTSSKKNTSHAPKVRLCGVLYY